MSTSKINVKSRHARPTCPDFFYQSLEDWKKARKSQCEWSVRLNEEFKRSPYTVFITLTFDDEHLPKLHYTPEISFDVPCFDGERISEQLIRPLRQVDGYRFKYVFFPEYGSDNEYIDDRGRVRKGTKRPHYHGLIFFTEVIDLEIFKQRCYCLWNSCKPFCMPIIHVSSNNGFSRYVSKYVSKGIERQHFPPKLLHAVSKARKYIADMRLKTSFTDLERYLLNNSVHFLHWYETHRPKLLCSRGIGDKDYDSTELLFGTTPQFNGQEFVDTPIPSYNLRKAYYDKGEDYDKRYFTTKDGLVEYHLSGKSYKLQTWSLNDIGRDALKFQLRTKRNAFVEQLNLCLSKSGPISYDNITRFNDSLCDEHLPLEYGTTYDDILLLLKGNLDLIGPDYLDYLTSYKFLFSKYSIVRFENITGLEYSKTLIHNWVSIMDFIIDQDSSYFSYGNNRLKSDGFDVIEDFQPVIRALDLIEFITDCVDYDSHIQAMNERKLQKEHNRQKYQTIL